jgi:hypothetical protein
MDCIETCGDSSRFRIRTCNGYGKECVCNELKESCAIEYSECKNNKSCPTKDGVWVNLI